MWATSLSRLSSSSRSVVGVSFPPPLLSLASSPHPVSLETSSLILDSHYFQWELYVVYISSQVCTGSKSSFRKDKKKQIISVTRQSPSAIP